MQLLLTRNKNRQPDGGGTPPPPAPPAETKVVPPAPAAENKPKPTAPVAENKPKPPTPAALPPVPPRPALAKAAPEKADGGYTVSKEGKVLRKQALRLWEGDIPQFIETNNSPDIHWRGGRIHLGLLCQCLRFFRHGVDKFDSEVQLRLAYNENTGEWCAVSFPQKVRRGALAVKEIKTDALTPTQREQRDSATSQMYQQGFTLNGTIHSHCNASAFQSGTDEKDETNQPGVHITLGHVSQDEIEVHGRVTYRGVQYPIHWNEWLDEITGMPDDSDKFVITLEKDRVNGYSYPEQWDDTLYEAPASVRTRTVSSPSGWPDRGYGYGFDYDGYGYGYGFGCNHDGTQSGYDPDWASKLRKETVRKVNNEPSGDEDDLVVDDVSDDALECFLPARKQFDTSEAWMSGVCSALWKTASKGSESYFDQREFDNTDEYEPIPISDAFGFFRKCLAEEMVLLLTCRKRLDEFDGRVAANIAPFLAGVTEAACEYVFEETTIADMQVYGAIGVRPSDDELVIRKADLSRTLSAFLEEYLQKVGDELFSDIVEALTPTTEADQWLVDKDAPEQEERVAVLWAMLQLVVHHTDLQIPGVVRRPQGTENPPPSPSETPDAVEDCPDEL